ncbi:MAG: DUF3299 domain-containing protein [Rhodocyclaceae bacterium]
MKTLLFALLFALGLLFTLPSFSAEPWPELKWEALVPKGWDPAAQFKGLDLSKLQDSDPRAIEALDRLKKEWDDAPAESSLDGQRIRIAGFALPLERVGEKVTEFLIVPYFGACIHTPPPPANQIIHAKSAKPLAGVKMMVPLWVYGTLSVKRGVTQWGVAGYRLDVDKVAPYKEVNEK